MLLDTFSPDVALECLTAQGVPEGSARELNRVARAQAIAVIFIGFGILRFLQGAGLGGLWIAFIGWFLLQAAGATYLQVQAGTLLRGLRVKDVMSTLHDSKKVAEMGFEQGIGYIPYAGMGWDAVRTILKNDASPIKAAAALQC